MRILAKISAVLATAVLLVSAMANGHADDASILRGTGDLGLVIERAHGSIQIIDTTHRAALGRVKGLGDLSHASAVYSRDGRYAYIFGRDGGLSKVDILQQRIVKRIVQGGNSIGGAISQDGSLVAVSNYKPGGVKVFNAATLEQVADIPAQASDGSGLSKVVGAAWPTRRGSALSFRCITRAKSGSLIFPTAPTCGSRNTRTLANCPMTA